MESTQSDHIRHLLDKYNQPGPRYTSYPTAPVWKSGADESVHRQVLRSIANRPDEPISLYIHIPFCEDRCLYCACNVTVRSDHAVGTRYLAHLETEIRLVAAELGFKPHVDQVHLGGGTPTFLSSDELRQLMAVLNDCFTINYLSGERSVEIDPVVTTTDQLDTLVDEGFNRFSFGVQDFNPEVQKAVRRIQPFDLTYRLVSHVRERGAQSINTDLIYGLPLQTPDSFRETLRQTLLLDPDRIALFSYAHVPWLHKHQQVLDSFTRPSAADKLDLLILAKDYFETHGLRLIGMDHFAKPEDELSIALDEGRLKRNFMGYTVMEGETILAFGNSAIGYHRGHYFQNEKLLKSWESRITAGQIPIESHYKMIPDDHIRKQAIMDIMIQFAVFYDEFAEKTGQDFATYFADELAGLADLIEDGLVQLFPDRLVVTDVGELFIRNVAMRFDRYLPAEPAVNRFSGTV